MNQIVALIHLHTIKSLNNKTTPKMAGIIAYLLILILNVKGFNLSTKKHFLTNWIKMKVQKSVVYRDSSY
jgi:hypothetical protein